MHRRWALVTALVVSLVPALAHAHGGGLMVLVVGVGAGLPVALVLAVLSVISARRARRAPDPSLAAYGRGASVASLALAALYLLVMARTAYLDLRPQGGVAALSAILQTLAFCLPLLVLATVSTLLARQVWRVHHAAREPEA
jgi:hypothetical protein